MSRLFCDIDLRAETSSFARVAGRFLNRGELAGQLECPPEISQESLAMRVYESWGLEGFARLSGPFSVVLYDAGRHELILLRDPMGQCSLFWGKRGSRCICSDEIPLVAEIAGRTPNPQGLRDFLTLGYMLPPHTKYREVQRIQAGSAVVVSGDGTARVHTYWRPAFEPENLSFQEAVEGAEEVLSRAVRRVADAGASHLMLSGGVDSNVLLGMLSCGGLQPVCVTAAFHESLYDESATAAASARTYGCEHRVCYGQMSDIPRVRERLKQREELFADSSLLPTMGAMELARGGMVITGSGGDELFGGYRRYRLMALREMLGTSGAGVFASAAGRLLKLAHAGERRSVLSSLKRLADSFAQTPLAGYLGYQQIFRDEELEELCPWLMKGTIGSLERLEALYEMTQGHLDERVNQLDIMSYLPDDGCLKLSLAAQNIEVLSPILDMEVVAFAMKLPRKLRASLLKSKPVLKGVGRGHLPKSLLEKGKKGFGVPVDDWFRTMEPVVCDERFEKRAVQKIIFDHRACISANGARLWCLMMACDETIAFR